MNEKLTTRALDKNLVYIKEVLVDDLPLAARESLEDDASMFAVHDAEGVRLALVADRKLAFHLAHENELVPQAVH